MDIERLKAAFIKADDAGNTEDAKVFADAIRKYQSGAVDGAPVDINARVAQAHDGSNDIKAVKAGILPMSYLVRGDNNGDGNPDVVEGTRRFDSSAGLLGVALDGASLVGDVSTGKTPIFDGSGHVSQDVIRRSFDLAAFSPASVGSNLSRKAAIASLPQRQRPDINAAQGAIQQADEFGINLSRGQATGDFKAQAFEQDALTGGRGAGAQSIIDGQRELQKDQITNATKGISENLSNSRVSDSFQAVDNVTETLQGKAKGLKDASSELYKAAEGAGAEIDPKAISGLSKGLRETLDSAGAMEGTVVAEEYPTAARALKRVDTLLSKAPEGKIVGVGWQNVERVRQVLLNKGSNSDEYRVLKDMRRKFDDWVENSVHNSLVSGDPKFLEDLKNARGLYRQYKSIVDNNSSIIRKMADGSVNSEQVANWLYGASKVGSRTDSSNTLREIKKLIGADNPAIDDLRKGVSLRLFQDKQGETKSAGKLANDILEFTNNQGHELAKELYGEKSLGQLRRFAAVLKKTVPDANATNPSKSGHTITRQVWDGLMNLAPVLGLAGGSMSGMLAGFGLKVGASKVARQKAAQLVNQPVPSRLPVPSIPLPSQHKTAVGAIRGSLLSGDRDSTTLPRQAFPAI